jgi:hypothetical protein
MNDLPEPAGREDKFFIPSFKCETLNPNPLTNSGQVFTKRTKDRKIRVLFALFITCVPDRVFPQPALETGRGVVSRRNF